MVLWNVASRVPCTRVLQRYLCAVTSHVPCARVLQRYGGSRYGAMSARYSSDGRRLFVLRRRLPPVLYDLRSSPAPLCQVSDAPVDTAASGLSYVG